MIVCLWIHHFSVKHSQLSLVPLLIPYLTYLFTQLFSRSSLYPSLDTDWPSWIHFSKFFSCNCSLYLQIRGSVCSHYRSCPVGPYFLLVTPHLTPSHFLQTFFCALGPLVMPLGCLLSLTNILIPHNHFHETFSSHFLDCLSFSYWSLDLSHLGAFLPKICALRRDFSVSH